MAGKFELYTDAKGKHRFRLKAGNGEIIAVSEAYESKSAAMNGIESIRHHAAEAPVQDMTAAAPKPGPSPTPSPKPAKPAAAASTPHDRMAHH